MPVHDSKGQEQLNRALKVAAAGEHNVLMIGPPDAGKTHLALSIPTFLLHMTIDKAIELTNAILWSFCCLPIFPDPEQAFFRSPSSHFECWTGKCQAIAFYGKDILDLVKLSQLTNKDFAVDS